MHLTMEQSIVIQAWHAGTIIDVVQEGTVGNAHTSSLSGEDWRGDIGSQWPTVEAMKHGAGGVGR